MSTLLERKLQDGRTVASVLLAPLREMSSLEFVDVGARNGSYLLPPSYAAMCRITGFEPNPVEYEKLVERRTDAMNAGLREPAFRDRRYFGAALWSEAGERTLFLTVGPGAVTLTGRASELMTANMFLASDSNESYFDRHQRVVGTQPMRCVTLDDLWKDTTSPVDILKIDVEGGELAVLKGAQSLLAQRRILLIFSEFLFVPYYADRVTLGHQQVYLDEIGYRLIAINTDQSAYSWRPSKIRPESDRWLTYAGDAIFVVDPDRNVLDAETSYRLGLACMAMGFNAFGLNLMRQSHLIRDDDIDMIESEANRVSFLRRMRNAWMGAPQAGDRFLQRIGFRR